MTEIQNGPTGKKLIQSAIEATEKTTKTLDINRQSMLIRNEMEKARRTQDNSQGEYDKI